VDHASDPRRGDVHGRALDHAVVQRQFQPVGGILPSGSQGKSRALEDEAKVIDSKVKEVVDKAKTSHTEYKKAQEGASLGPMYG